SHSQSRLCSPAHTRGSQAESPSSRWFDAAFGFRLEEQSKTEPALERALSAPAGADERPRAPTKRSPAHPRRLARGRLPQPLRSKSVSAYSLPSTTGSPEKGCSWSSRARSSTRRILPEIV